MSGGNSSNSKGRKTPQERVEMIKEIYKGILQREPSTRDINYYKYSTLDENQIRKQLITSSEHKDLIKNGNQYKKLKEQTEQLQTRTKMLESQIQDQLDEFKELNILLKEKNHHIQDLRNTLAQQNNLPAKYVPQCIQTPRTPSPNTAAANSRAAQPQQNNSTRNNQTTQSQQSTQQLNQPIPPRQTPLAANTIPQSDKETTENVENADETETASNVNSQPPQPQEIETAEIQQPREPSLRTPETTDANESLQQPNSQISQPYNQQIPQNPQYPQNTPTQQAENLPDNYPANPSPNPPPPPQNIDNTARSTSAKTPKSRNRLKETLNSIFGQVF
jgi:hypothetical protein